MDNKSEQSGVRGGGIGEVVNFERDALEREARVLVLV
jgi:hypothetical protein